MKCEKCGSEIFVESSQISGTVNLYFGTTAEAQVQVEDEYMNYDMYANISHSTPKTCRCANCGKRYLRNEVLNNEV